MPSVGGGSINSERLPWLGNQHGGHLLRRVGLAPLAVVLDEVSISPNRYSLAYPALVSAARALLPCLGVMWSYSPTRACGLTVMGSYAVLLMLTNLGATT